MPVLVPLFKEQYKLSTFLGLIDQRIETQNKIIQNLESLIKGIRKRVFKNVTPNYRLGEIADIYQPQTIATTDCNSGPYFVYGANGIIGQYHKYNHEKEQICITCRGNTCGTINYSRPYSWITGNSMVVNVDGNDNIDKRYLFHYLSTINFNNIISGSGQPQIVRAPLLKLKVYIPDKTKQTKLAKMFDLLCKRLTIEWEVLKKYQSQKQYLLQQMFI